jgi:hypothetical protein
MPNDHRNTIRSILAADGHNISDLARAVGKSPQFVHQALHPANVRRLSASDIDIIHHRFGIPVVYLLKTVTTPKALVKPATQKKCGREK